MTTWTARVPGRRARTKPVAKPVAVSTEVSVLTDTLTVIAIVCAWLVIQLLVLSGVSFDRSQTVLYDRFREQAASATAPVGGVIDLGAPVGTVTIPGTKSTFTMVEGTSSSQTMLGPGHLRSSVLPGQPGTSVLFGRAATYGAPFADLGDLLPGDKITTATGQGKATYEVTDVRRAGDPLPQPLKAGAGRLTLVGAQGSGQLSALSPGQVMYVDADLVSKPFELGDARLASVSRAELPMGRDTSVMPVLTLVLAGLAALVVASVFGRQRLGTARTWVLLSAPVIALAWLATDLGMALMPNLM